MHHPVIVARQGDDDEVVMLSRTETLEALDRFRFDPRLKSDEGELIISVPEIEIDGVGSTFEAALADASKQIEDYAIRYFERIPFYKQTHRAPHFPYLLRFMLTPKEARSTLLLSDSEASLGPELVRA